MTNSKSELTEPQDSIIIVGSRGVEDVKLHHGNAINKISMRTATRQMIFFFFFPKKILQWRWGRRPGRNEEMERKPID